MGRIIIEKEGSITRDYAVRATIAFYREGGAIVPPSIYQPRPYQEQMGLEAYNCLSGQYQRGEYPIDLPQGLLTFIKRERENKTRFNPDGRRK